MEWSLVGLAAIITAMVGLFKFFDERAAKKNGETLKDIEGKIDKLADNVAKGQHEDRLAIMRLELMNLIQLDPTNTIEIEKLAKEYFGPKYHGNKYMTSTISRWCKEQKIDPSTILMK